MRRETNRAGTGDHQHREPDEHGPVERHRLRPISDRQHSKENNERHRDADDVVGNAPIALVGQGLANRTANLRPTGGGPGTAALDQKRSRQD